MAISFGIHKQNYSAAQVKTNVGTMCYLLLLFFFFGFRPGHYVSKELSWKLQKGLIQLEMERACAFFMLKKWLEGSYPLPPMPTISQNTPNKNFEIDILL